MSHNHNHSCSCSHNSVKFCKHCNTCYCLDCNQEWPSYKYTYTQPYTPLYPWYSQDTITYTGAPITSANSIMSSQSGSPVTTIQCKHEG